MTLILHEGASPFCSIQSFCGSTPNRNLKKSYFTFLSRRAGQFFAGLDDKHHFGGKSRKIVTTSPSSFSARGVLTDHGYEVLVFHATGIGGRAMESMIADGYITACLDITTTELADEVCGGRASAGPARGMAASRAGIPAVIAPGCVDMANFGARDSVPERYRGRNLFQWTPTGTLLRTNVEENERIGAIIAAAANASAAPVTILLPLGGVSMLDSEGGVFWDPEADSACYEAIKDNLKPGIDVLELGHNINDPPFADRAAEVLLRMLGQ